ncbi:hypothetical protein Bbelb_399240 [Branchiostoma belcheri]|nr:hypothetical protein Bbelb_399240 [Branchiostoma belcheri]
MLMTVGSCGVATECSTRNLEVPAGQPVPSRLLSPAGAGRGYISDGHRRNWDRNFTSLTGQRGHIRSGTDVTSDHCEWDITTDPDRIILINFDRGYFRRGSDGCQTEVLTFYDGGTENSRMVDTFCRGQDGPLAPYHLSVASTGHQLHVVLTRSPSAPWWTSVVWYEFYLTFTTRETEDEPVFDEKTFVAQTEENFDERIAADFVRIKVSWLIFDHNYVWPYGYRTDRNILEFYLAIQEHVLDFALPPGIRYICEPTHPETTLATGEVLINDRSDHHHATFFNFNSYVFVLSNGPWLSLGHNPPHVLLRAFYVGKRRTSVRDVSCRPHSYTLRNRASDVRRRHSFPTFSEKNVADVASPKAYGQKARTAGCDRGFRELGQLKISTMTFPRDDWPWIAFYIYRPWEENVAIMKYTYWNVKVGEENSELNGIECVVNGQRFPIEVIVKACPIGRFGRFCAERCQCYNGAACHSFNGACRCAPGWTGRNCTTVHPEVRISPSTSELNDLRFGQELQLNCTAYNFRVNNFNWFLNGVPVNRSLLAETSDNSSSVLYIRSLLPKYEGHVTCEAGSVGGDQYTDAVDIHIAGCQDNVWGEACDQVCNCTESYTCNRTLGCVCYGDGCSASVTTATGEYRLRTESYGFGSTQTRRRTISACKTFSTCGLRIHHPYVRVRATRVSHTCRVEEARVNFTVSQTVLLATSLSAGGLILLLLGAIFLLYRHNNRLRVGNIDDPEIFQLRQDMKSLMPPTAGSTSGSIDMELLKENEIDRSRLQGGQLLGEGAFGHVVKATLSRPEEDDLVVAVKKLKDDDDLQARQALLRETCIMLLCGNHDNVLMLKGICFRDGPVQLVLEYAEHGSLLHLLWTLRAESKLNRTVLICLEIKQMAHLREHDGRSLLRTGAPGDEEGKDNLVLQLVHRDIAARNILICGKGTAKIADFGLARDMYAVGYHRQNRVGPGHVRCEVPSAGQGGSRDMYAVRYHRQGRAGQGRSRDMYAVGYHRQDRAGQGRSRDMYAVGYHWQGRVGPGHVRCEVPLAGQGRSRDMYAVGYHWQDRGHVLLPLKWMAPEGLKNEARFTHKSDVWSFGVLMWEVAQLGRTPYPGVDGADRIYDALQNHFRLPRPQLCTEERYQLMLKCWKFNEKTRPDATTVRKLLEADSNGFFYFNTPVAAVEAPVTPV